MTSRCRAEYRGWQVVRVRYEPVGAASSGPFGVGRARPRRRSGATISRPGIPLGSAVEVAGRDVTQHPVDEPAVHRLDDDRVAGSELVEVEEGRALADPVPGEAHVARLPRQRRARVVARAPGVSCFSPVPSSTTRW